MNFRPRCLRKSEIHTCMVRNVTSTTAQRQLKLNPQIVREYVINYTLVPLDWKTTSNSIPWVSRIVVGNQWNLHRRHCNSECIALPSLRHQNFLVLRSRQFCEQPPNSPGKITLRYRIRPKIWSWSIIDLESRGFVIQNLIWIYLEQFICVDIKISLNGMAYFNKAW